MVAQNNLVTDKKCVLVPPDGGWGYMICVAAILIFIAASAFLSCYGMIFNDFFVELGMGSADVTLLTGVNSVSIAVTGLVTGPLMKATSMRKLAFVGSALFTAGTLGTAFVNTRAMLFFCQGILQHFGSGMIFTITFTALNDYFKKKRVVALSVVNTVTAATAMVAPLAVKWTNAAYGFKGTIYMVSAVGALTFVGSSLLQPVAWHMKEEIEPNLAPDTKELVQKDDTPQEIPIINLKDLEKEIHDLFPNQNINLIEKKSVLSFVKKYLDWPNLKGYLLTFTCFALPTCIFAEITFMIFLPQYLYSQKWSNDSVAFAISLQGFGDLTTRVLLIFSTAVFRKLGSHLLYVLGLALGIAAKLALTWISDYKTVLATIMLSGVPRCTINVLFPLVMSDTVSPQLFPLAFGMHMVIFGLSGIVLGPLVGALRDATGDYATMFYALTAIQVLGAVVMTFESTRKRQRQVNDQPRLYSNQI